jgi:prevent-host-death family protein
MDSLPPAGTVSTISSRDFNQNSGRAKKAAKNGPVFITERGQPAYVLLTVEQYKSLSKPACNMAELLAQKDGPYFDFEPPRLDGPFMHPVDFD